MHNGLFSPNFFFEYFRLQTSAKIIHGLAGRCIQLFVLTAHFRFQDYEYVRLTRRVPLVGHELLTLPEHLSSPPVFSGVRVTRSLVLYVCFVDRCLSFCTFFFWPWCCLFFDVRFLIAPLISSNSSS